MANGSATGARTGSGREAAVVVQAAREAQSKALKSLWNRRMAPPSSGAWLPRPRGVAGLFLSAKDPPGEKDLARQLERFENLVSLFLARAAEKGDKPFLWAKRDGKWRSISWEDAARQVAALSASLRRIGLQPGERIALVRENPPEV